MLNQPIATPRVARMRQSARPITVVRPCELSKGQGCRPHKSRRAATPATGRRTPTQKPSDEAGLILKNVPLTILREMLNAEPTAFW